MSLCVSSDWRTHTCTVQQARRVVLQNDTNLSLSSLSVCFSTTARLYTPACLHWGHLTLVATSCRMCFSLPSMWLLSPCANAHCLQKQWPQDSATGWYSRSCNVKRCCYVTYCILCGVHKVAYGKVCSLREYTARATNRVCATASDRQLT